MFLVIYRYVSVRILPIGARQRCGEFRIPKTCKTFHNVWVYSGVRYTNDETQYISYLPVCLASHICVGGASTDFSVSATPPSAATNSYSTANRTKSEVN